jgi:hypothetical protein
MVQFTVQRAAKSPRAAARLLIKETAKAGLDRLGTILWSSSQARRGELARRDTLRAALRGRWFVDEERRLVRALAELVVPSTEEGPGAGDLEIVEPLEALVVGSPQRRTLYGRGLLAFDDLGRHEHGAAFADLPTDEQARLVRDLDRRREEMRDRRSVGNGLRSLWRILRYQRSGAFAAIELWPTLIADVTEVFYTSPLSWMWLGYDGPPMPRGYSDVTATADTKRTPEDMAVPAKSNAAGSV